MCGVTVKTVEYNNMKLISICLLPAGKCSHAVCQTHLHINIYGEMYKDTSLH